VPGELPAGDAIAHRAHQRVAQPVRGKGVGGSPAGIEDQRPRTARRDEHPVAHRQGGVPVPEELVPRHRWQSERRGVQRGKGLREVGAIHERVQQSRTDGHDHREGRIRALRLVIAGFDQLAARGRRRGAGKGQRVARDERYPGHKRAAVIDAGLPALGPRARPHGGTEDRRGQDEPECADRRKRTAGGRPFRRLGHGVSRRLRSCHGSVVPFVRSVQYRGKRRSRNPIQLSLADATDQVCPEAGLLASLSTKFCNSAADPSPSGIGAPSKSEPRPT
jgi:hypothetical protein